MREWRWSRADISDVPFPNRSTKESAWSGPTGEVISNYFFRCYVTSAFSCVGLKLVSDDIAFWRSQGIRTREHEWEPLRWNFMTPSGLKVFDVIGRRTSISSLRRVVAVNRYSVVTSVTIELDRITSDKGFRYYFEIISVNPIYFTLRYTSRKYLFVLWKKLHSRFFCIKHINIR